jgi:hypothetical protein
MTDAPSISALASKTSPNFDHFDLLNSINRRRRELALEMGGSGNVSLLALGSLIDTLLILAFDEACTQRSMENNFWGGKDKLAKLMVQTASDRLRQVYDYNESDIVTIMGKGTVAAHGFGCAADLWEKKEINSVPEDGLESAAVASAT